MINAKISHCYSFFRFLDVCEKASFEHNLFFAFSIDIVDYFSKVVVMVILSFFYELTVENNRLIDGVFMVVYLISKF